MVAFHDSTLTNDNHVDCFDKNGFFKGAHNRKLFGFIDKNCYRELDDFILNIWRFICNFSFSSLICIQQERRGLVNWLESQNYLIIRIYNSHFKLCTI